MQGADERTLQVSRWVIDRAEDGGREVEFGGEPAAMLKMLRFWNIPRGRVMGFPHQYARVRVMRSGGKTATTTMKKGVSGNG